MHENPVEHALLIKKLKQAAITKAEVVSESFKEPSLKAVEDNNPTILKFMPKGKNNQQTGLLKASLVNFVTGQLQIKSELPKYAFYEDELIHTKNEEQLKPVDLDEQIDDTVLDEYKVVMHLAEMERQAENFQFFVNNKVQHFTNMKQLLNDSKFLTQPFKETMTAFNKDNFLRPEHLNNEKLQWEDIEKTTLGRRLDGYF